MHIKIALIEDSASFSSRLEELLVSEPQITCEHILDKSQLSLAKLPNIDGVKLVLIDLELSDYESINLLSKLKKQFPGLTYLMLMHFDSDEKLFDTLKSGADGYILKQDHPELIIENIRGAVNGRAPMSMPIAKKVLNFFHKAHENMTMLSPLSDKETEILSLLSTGLLYKEIAITMDMSIDSIKKHCGSIYKKLHVHNRTEAINRFLDR
ncbi:MAG: LuxR C-terminal-related transcriptional regulator [Chitinophagales bacterium]